MTDEHNSQEMSQKIHELEDMVGELRAIIGERRTMLNNADKKLQQFQDSISAVLMEEKHPSRRPHDHDEE